ncbi:MAG: hypothetical protein ACTHQM_09210, partial [Thermoanaerobaculia bacterium]
MRSESVVGCWLWGGGGGWWGRPPPPGGGGGGPRPPPPPYEMERQPMSSPKQGVIRVTAHPPE